MGTYKSRALVRLGTLSHIYCTAGFLASLIRSTVEQKPTWCPYTTMHTIFTTEGSMVGYSIRKNMKALLAAILWSYSYVSQRRIERFILDFHSYLEGIKCSGDSTCRLFKMSCRSYIFEHILTYIWYKTQCYTTRSFF